LYLDVSRPPEAILKNWRPRFSRANLERQVVILVQPLSPQKNVHYILYIGVSHPRPEAILKNWRARLSCPNLEFFRFHLGFNLRPLPQTEKKCPLYFMFRRFASSWSYIGKIATTFPPSKLKFLDLSQEVILAGPSPEKMSAIFCI